MIGEVLIGAELQPLIKINATLFGTPDVKEC
jgi:hypothetical protein